MSSVRYPDFPSSHRSDRTVRMLTVAGIAVLVRTVAGGFSVFAIVSALNGPPRQEVSADGRRATQATLAGVPVVKAAPAPVPAAQPATAPDASIATAATPPMQTELTPTTQPHATSPTGPQTQMQNVPSAQPPEAAPDVLSLRVARHLAQVNGRRLNQSGASWTPRQGQALPLWNYSPLGGCLRA